MKVLSRSIPTRSAVVAALALVVLTVFAVPAHAQSPIVRMVSRVAQDTAIIAGLLSVVAVAVGGLTMAFGHGGASAKLANVFFGVALASGATSVVAWIVS